MWPRGGEWEDEAGDAARRFSRSRARGQRPPPPRKSDLSALRRFAVEDYSPLMVRRIAGRRRRQGFRRRRAVNAGAAVRGEERVLSRPRGGDPSVGRPRARRAPRGRAARRQGRRARIEETKTQAWLGLALCDSPPTWRVRRRQGAASGSRRRGRRLHKSPPRRPAAVRRPAAMPALNGLVARGR
ncbi:hypothetical protein BRADI_4g36745v3 [Brachypodium distachyon]|uniref:Uncharacterized protein n=1 Tax=Brachypodium distachyon TaxID=15368 RepID=A0A2K2CSQ1_BRADI|nr:hypothetical protein BRADI_4g36745v3 [Brachypodium distachyon]